MKKPSFTTPPRALTQALLLGSVLLLLWFFHPPTLASSIRWTPRTMFRTGSRESLGRHDLRPQDIRVGAEESQETDRNTNRLETTTTEEAKFEEIYRPGTAKPIGESYTKTLVIARIKAENVDWLEENFGQDEQIRFAVYTADDPDSERHPPQNKGHETMIYLSYIIDNYQNLSDVNIFLHAHRYSWHNNQLLGNDAVHMISRLSPERVRREGYLNTRCQWEPGCPSWMHPGTVEEDSFKQEETLLARSWTEIFPLDPIPLVLAQPCCAQFAVSKERIQALPLSRYVFFRDWLLNTPLSDDISGRVWEYLWQYVFTGDNVFCPKEHICQCDGFGICFGGEEELSQYYEKEKERVNLEEELRTWRDTKDRIWHLQTENDTSWEQIEAPEEGKDEILQGLIDELRVWSEQNLEEARQRGDVAMNRAFEVGREWNGGDEF